MQEDKPTARTDFLKNRTESYRLHKLAEAYSQRPSRIIGIDDEWLAFQFDHSILAWGRYVDNKLEETVVVNKKTNERKKKWTLEEILEGRMMPENVTSMTDLFLASGADRMELG